MTVNSFLGKATSVPTSGLKDVGWKNYMKMSLFNTLSPDFPTALFIANQKTFSKSQWFFSHIMIIKLIPNVLTAKSSWQPTIPECIYRTNLSSFATLLTAYIHTYMYTYWSLWKRVWEGSIWRWHGHGHRHWHCSNRSTNWCCEPTPSSSSSRAPFLHIICESNINKICLYPRGSFCLKKRETRISPHHRLGSKKAISMKEVYWG